MALLDPAEETQLAGALLKGRVSLCFYRLPDLWNPEIVPAVSGCTLSTHPDRERLVKIGQGLLTRQSPWLISPLPPLSLGREMAYYKAGARGSQWRMGPNAFQCLPRKSQLRL